MNVWECNYKMTTSNRAYSDYLTRDETKELRKWYRDNHMQQFHSCNAAIKNGHYSLLETFYSYYTPIISISEMINDKWYIWPNYEYFKYSQSNTTNTQLTRYLSEKTKHHISINEFRSFLFDSTTAIPYFVESGTINYNGKYNIILNARKDAGFIYNPVAREIHTHEIIPIDKLDEKRYSVVISLEEI